MIPFKHSILANLHPLQTSWPRGMYFKISLKYIVTVSHFSRKLKMWRQHNLKVSPSFWSWKQTAASALVIIYCLYKTREVILILYTFAPDVQDKERLITVWGKAENTSKGWEGNWQLETGSKSLNPPKAKAEEDAIAGRTGFGCKRIVEMEPEEKLLFL